MVLVSAVLLNACATENSKIVEFFDEGTVTAIVRIDEPVLYVSRRPDLSYAGGDMISMGPVSTILSGEENVYLWCGFWTTIDRFQSQESAPEQPSSIIVQTVDERIELQLDATIAAVNGPKWRVYPKPSPGVRDAYYRVSEAQLAKIAGSQVIHLMASSQAEAGRRYVGRSDIGPLLRTFLEYTSGWKVVDIVEPED